MVLGSFAYGNDRNIDTLVRAGVIPPLLATLSAKDLRLVEAGARALRAVLMSDDVSRREIFQVS